MQGVIRNFPIDPDSARADVELALVEVSVTADSGGSGIGWLAFFVHQPGVTGPALQYERQAAGVIGSDEEITAEVFSVPLPDPAG